jgi:Amt family ammonium transporter
MRSAGNGMLNITFLLWHASCVLHQFDPQCDAGFFFGLAHGSHLDERGVQSMYDSTTRRLAEKPKWWRCLILLLLLGCPSVAAAAEGVPLSAGDTTFVFISTALVMLMTPGLGLFYGGMVRQKNVLGTIMQSFVVIGLISLQWAFFGYSLAFGTDHHGLLGGLNFLCLQGVGAAPNPDYAATIPHQAFMIFQAMFAVITPALITGAFAERFRFSAFLWFMLLWATCIYDPIAHWIWGAGGWLRQLGVLDFAGGMVVHVSAGFAALVAAFMVGKRRAHVTSIILPHNMTMVLLGAALLWFGWFGFNAGSALAANGVAISAFIATNFAGASALLVWMLLEWLVRGKPTALGAASGAIAGLAAVTPASGFVGPMSAILIGAIASPLCFLAIQVKNKFGYDDTLDAFGVHGVGGTWGTLATGLFASTTVNAAGANGLFFGNPHLLGVQALGVLVTASFSAAGTFLLLKLLDALVGIRVPEHEEMIGLDLTQHGEAGYHM